MIGTVLEILITQPIIFESSFMFNLISPTIPNIPSLESQRETREVPVMTHMSHTTFREKKVCLSANSYASAQYKYLIFIHFLGI